MSAWKLDRVIVVTLLGTLSPVAAPAQGGFVAGARTIATLDFTAEPVGDVPKGLRPHFGKLDVVDKDGVHMLRASSPSDFVLRLPEDLPRNFTIEFDLIPKACCNPVDLMVEGVVSGSRSSVSAQIEWDADHFAVVGGNPEMFQMDMPAAIAASLPSARTKVALSFEDETIKMFTNGTWVYTLTNRKFMRKKVLHISLGGQDEDKYAVYLASVRVADLAPSIVASNDPQAGPRSASPMPTEPNVEPQPAVTPPRGASASTVPAGFNVTVTPSNTGPVVTWSPVAGAGGYGVSRWKIDDLTCCNSNSGRGYTAMSPWQDQPLPMSGTYVYRVIANTPAGIIHGETQFGFRMPEVGTAPLPNAVLVAPTTSGTITPTQTTTTSAPTPVATSPATRTTPTVLSNAAAPTNLTAHGSPVAVWLNWEVVPGAIRYEISRAPQGTTTWTSLGAPPSYPDAPNFRDFFPHHTTTYTYRVAAFQSDGSYGTATVDFAPPTPTDPATFTSKQTGPGQVEFEWDFVPGGATKYFLTGPGTGTGIVVFGGAHMPGTKNHYTLSGIAAGTHTWTIATNWEPGGILTPSGSWPKTTATVVADPGPRYRLVALGFRALQQSKDIDDARDGHGDEIYFSAIVNRTQFTGQLPVTKAANLMMVMSRSHGDEAVSVPYGRIKAGTASPTGGIKSGDVVPAALDPAAPTGPLQQLTFPLPVWEGTLGDSDAVVVHPALWEDDVNPVVQAIWTKTVLDAATSGYAVFAGPFNSTAKLLVFLNEASKSSSAGIRTISNGLEPGFRQQGLQGDLLFECTVIGINLYRRPCEAHGVDRPLGLEVLDLNMGFAWGWSERIVLLTRASVQAALAGTPYEPYNQWPRGTFSIKLWDQISPTPQDIEAVAKYELFFRIERIP